jgi:polyhydroxyalkanoate synthesis regulator protein
MDNINAKQLNNTIDDIVKEAKTLKNVVEMQKEIVSTKSDIQKSSANIEKLLAEEAKNTKMLGDLIMENNSFIQSVNVYNEKIRQQNELFQKELSALIEKQRNDLKEEYNKFNASNNELHKKLLTALETKFDEFQKQNKEFQKELDGSIFTRLEKHKSDIQIEIRNEGTQIQRAFENTITNQFNNFENKQNEKFATITKNQEKNKTISIISLTTLIATLILLIIKFFVLQ